MPSEYPVPLRYAIKVLADRPQGIAVLRLLNAFAGQSRASHAGVENRMTLVFEPLPELGDLRAAAYGVRSLDNDQLALEFRQIDARQRLTLGIGQDI